MIFSARPDRPWGPPSLLYNGYRVFSGGKVRPERAADHSPFPAPRDHFTFFYLYIFLVIYSYVWFFIYTVT